MRTKRNNATKDAFESIYRELEELNLKVNNVEAKNEVNFGLISRLNSQVLKFENDQGNILESKHTFYESAILFLENNIDEFPEIYIKYYIDKEYNGLYKECEYYKYEILHDIMKELLKDLADFKFGRINDIRDSLKTILNGAMIYKETGNWPNISKEIEFDEKDEI